MTDLAWKLHQTTVKRKMTSRQGIESKAKKRSEGQRLKERGRRKRLGGKQRRKEKERRRGQATLSGPIIADSTLRCHLHPGLLETCQAERFHPKHASSLPGLAWLHRFLRAGRSSCRAWTARTSPYLPWRVQAVHPLHPGNEVDRAVSSKLRLVSRLPGVQECSDAIKRRGGEIDR